MHTVYPSLAKSNTFPLVTRVSSQPRCSKLFHVLKFQSLPVGLLLQPYFNPMPTQPTKVSDFHCKTLNMRNVVRYGGASGFLGNGVTVCCFVMLRAKSRGFASYTLSVSERSSSDGATELLPWIVPSRGKKERGMLNGRVNAKSAGSSWTESVKRLEGAGKSPSFDDPVNIVDKGLRESRKRSEKGVVRKTDIGTVPRRNSKDMVGGKRGRSRIVDSEVVDQRYEGVDRSFEGGEEEIEEQPEDLEVVDDPRWDKIRSKFGGMVDVNGRKDKPEFQRWNKQENWGRKVWREASESSVPKMVGEAVYGVGPVLAALSAGRREFYALYVQEGLDLSGNNRKKKDKKGFEKILKIAEAVELNIKEVLKHDLNMAVNNRPHQGLVLDASPLELVKIKELDPAVPEEEENLLWVALDEVTDPQNLGAIIRSAYFFCVTGVILCAKNSAPLSGVVSKASAGSLEVMELRYCENMMQFLVSSVENGWRVIGGSVSSKAIPLSRILPGVPTILVLGSEGTGLRPLVERSCTQLVKIPGNIRSDVARVVGADDAEAEETDMRCSTEDFRSFLAVESLNVSVAAGVLLNHLVGNNQLDNQV